MFDPTLLVLYRPLKPFTTSKMWIMWSVLPFDVQVFRKTKKVGVVFQQCLFDVREGSAHLHAELFNLPRGLLPGERPSHQRAKGAPPRTWCPSPTSKGRTNQSA